MDPNAPTPQMFARVSEKLGRAGGGIVIGEWSGAFNPGSLTGDPSEVGKYIKAQLDLYEKHSAGWYFWTYKKQYRGDTGWSFRDSVEGAVFPSWVGLRYKTLVSENDKNRCAARDESREKALGLFFSSLLAFGPDQQHIHLQRIIHGIGRSILEPTSIVGLETVSRRDGMTHTRSSSQARSSVDRSQNWDLRVLGRNGAQTIMVEATGSMVSSATLIIEYL